jgi:carbon monoxide dehydrogenase subunit G
VKHTTAFEVAVPRDRVVAYLSDPRHLVQGNHPGPVIERSEGDLASGSWFVLAFDQIRARIEYTAYEPPSLIRVTVTMSGRLSGGSHGVEEFRLAQAGEGRTRVEIDTDGTGSWIRWAPLMRVSQNLLWRRLAKKIEAEA